MWPRFATIAGALKASELNLRASFATPSPEESDPIARRVEGGSCTLLLSNFLAGKNVVASLVAVDSKAGCRLLDQSGACLVSWTHF